VSDCQLGRLRACQNAISTMGKFTNWLLAPNFQLHWLPSWQIESSSDGQLGSFVSFCKIARSTYREPEKLIADQIASSTGWKFVRLPAWQIESSTDFKVCRLQIDSSIDRKLDRFAAWQIDKGLARHIESPTDCQIGIASLQLFQTVKTEAGKIRTTPLLFVFFSLLFT
jgi:hypothetical protein